MLSGEPTQSSLGLAQSEGALCYVFLAVEINDVALEQFSLLTGKAQPWAAF